MFAMASKKGERDPSRHYDEVTAARAREAVRQFVKENGGEVQAAAKLGYAQPSLSRVLSGEQQPQLRLMIALAAKTGRSLDDLLGIGPPRQTAPSATDAATIALIADAVSVKLGTLQAAGRFPTAAEYGAHYGNWSRQLTAAMTKEHGDERRAPQDWKPLFQAKMAAVRLFHGRKRREAQPKLRPSTKKQAG